MSWDARQRAMLEAMGLRVWTPLSDALTQAPVLTQTQAPIESLVPDVAPSTRTAPSPSNRPFSSPTATVAASIGGVANAKAPSPSPGEARHVAQLLPSPMEARASTPAVNQPADDVQRTARIAGLDWEALQAEVAQCRACGLCDSRKNTVFGVGHPQAHWMVVGEAPGEQEDLRGEPFVGAAGQLLDNMLRALGLGRGEGGPEQQVFIANTLKCRPPRNRNPDPQELARCEPFLQRQIELVQPRIILAMGRFAVQTLLNSSEPIGRLRGRVHHYRDVPVIVTYHPAYLLRNLVDKGRAWEDLCLARAVLDGQAA